MSDDNLATRINRFFVIPSSKLQWRFRSTACICGTARRTILALINLFAADGGVAPRGSAERKIKECNRSMRMLLEEDSSLLVADNRRFTELVLSIPNRSGTARRSRSTFAAKNWGPLADNTEKASGLGVWHMDCIVKKVFYYFDTPLKNRIISDDSIFRRMS